MREETQAEIEEREYQEALKYLKLDEKEITDREILTITKDKNMSDKVTKLNEIATAYKMILEGRTFIEEDNGWKQTGQAIAGKKFIALSYGIINSFSQESNLLTQKDIDKFNIQFIDAFEKVNNFILRDRSVSERDSRIIIKMFKDKLTNIGDIITGSAENMAKVFGNYEQGNLIDYGDRKLDGVL